MQPSKQPLFEEGFTAIIRLNGGIELTAEYGSPVIITIPDKSSDIAFETIKNTLISHVHDQIIHYNEKVGIIMLIDALLVAHKIEVIKNISVDLEDKDDSNKEG